VDFLNLKLVVTVLGGVNDGIPRIQKYVGLNYFDVRAEQAWNLLV